MSILIFLIISYILLSISLKKLFEKAGVEGSKAFIPGVNFVEWCKIIGRKPSYALWLLFPIVNLFIFCGMAVDLVRSFGKYKFIDSALAVIYAPLAFFLTGNDEKAKYLGQGYKLEKEFNDKLMEAQKNNDKYALKKLQENNPYQKGAVREWVEAVFFAVFAAAFIRMFLIEAYVIPTSSMEGSLLVGDFLFVSKAHYGIRMPMTVAQIPLLHNRIPYIDKESYLDNPKLPYYRLPALQSVQHNDPVVFNWPVGDSVYIAPDRSFDIKQAKDLGFDKILGDKYLVVRPVDKKDHYIKRCIGLPGDSLKVVNKQVFINGQAAHNPTNMQFRYSISGNINKSKLEEWGVNLEDGGGNIFHLTQAQVDKLKSVGGVTVTPVPFATDPKHLFPYDTTLTKNWSVDNYGSIWIPKKGATVELTPQNRSLYWRVIKVYEGNDWEVKGGKAFINGKEAATYTFKQDYYWMMGDNRHNSEDSRVWGFVPEDHIVGKPLFIWFSTKNANIRNGIRWNRMFTSANKQ